MIGVSLPLDWLITGEGLPEDRQTVLNELKALDVRSIELRTVRSRHSAFDVWRVADRLWDKGFMITVHGDLCSVENAVTELFTPLELLLKNLRQPSLNITVHPIVGDNVKALTDVSNYILKNGLPVTLTLENNRLMPDKTDGDIPAFVLDIVKTVDRENVGICFDLGHHMYNVRKNCPDGSLPLPDKEFMKRVRHTHIHALNELKTHFPLKGYDLPLKEIFGKLAFEYFGLYNLELDFPRFKNICRPLTALTESVRELRANLAICTTVYDEVRDNFDKWFLSALKVLKGNERGTKFSLIHSSSYLFNTNGYRWGMDIAFRNARILATTPDNAAELLKDLDLMVVSHGHRDHFEASTVRLLADTPLHWVIPDFLLDTALEYGIAPDKIYVAHEGESLTVGELTLLTFKGRHFRPGTTKGVEEYGYYVTAKDSPSIAFPVDVRNLSPEDLPDIPKADYCFANVWLGDGKGLETDYTPIDREYAEFMLNFSDKNLLLTHLNEDGRADRDMWLYRHAELVTDKVAELSPTTIVRTPQRGEIIKL